VQACARAAISLQQGKAVINEARCVQCGYCVTQCPVHAIGEQAALRTVEPREGSQPAEGGGFHRFRQRLRQWRTK